MEEKHSECPNNAFKINGVTFNKYGLTIAKTIVLSNNQFHGVLMVELAAMLDITINKQDQELKTITGKRRSSISRGQQHRYSAARSTSAGLRLSLRLSLRKEPLGVAVGIALQLGLHELGRTSLGR